jgi:hypothetical protein
MASRDRVRGRRWLGDAFTIPASDLLTRLLKDLPALRLTFECLGHHFAKLAQSGAAALATGTRRRIDNPLSR